jgi:hypothetical protein
LADGAQASANTRQDLSCLFLFKEDNMKITDEKIADAYDNGKNTYRKYVTERKGVKAPKKKKKEEKPEPVEEEKTEKIIDKE